MNSLFMQLDTVNWENLKIFYYTAINENIPKAANRLGVSNNLVTKKINELEINLDLKLIKNNRGKLSLTSEGVYLLKKVSEAFDFIGCSKENVVKEGQKVLRTLRIYSCVSSARLIAHNFNSFLEKNENICISIRFSNNLPNLHKHDFDIGLFQDLIDSTKLAQIEVCKFRMKLYATKEYLDKYGYPKDSLDLVNHKIISFSNKKSIFYGRSDVFDWFCPQINRSKRRVSAHFQFDNSVDFTYATLTHQGIATLPTCMFTKKYNLINVLPEEFGEECKIFFTYPIASKEDEVIHKMKKFVSDLYRMYINCEETEYKFFY